MVEDGRNEEYLRLSSRMCAAQYKLNIVTIFKYLITIDPRQY